MSKTHYVYFIEAGSFRKSPVKIGVTIDIDARIKNLQTGNPYPLKCKALIECKSRKEAYNLESYLHHRLKRFRLEGEWFKSEYFNLKKLLGEYVRERVKVKATDEYMKERLPMSSVGSLHRDVKKLKVEIENLKVENDNLTDQLNNTDNSDSWMFK